MWPYAFARLGSLPSSAKCIHRRTMLCCSLDFGPNASLPLLERTHTCFKMLALPSYAIVAEMAVDIANVLQRIVFGAEAQVAVFVEPDSQRADFCDQHP